MPDPRLRVAQGCARTRMSAKAQYLVSSCRRHPERDALKKSGRLASLASVRRNTQLARRGGFSPGGIPGGKADRPRTESGSLLWRGSFGRAKHFGQGPDGKLLSTQVGEGPLQRRRRPGDASPPRGDARVRREGPRRPLQRVQPSATGSQRVYSNRKAVT